MLVSGWQTEADFPLPYLYQLNQGKHVAYINAAPKARGSLCLTLDTDDSGVAHALDASNFIGK